MSATIICYEIENRSDVLSQIAAEGKMILEDATIDLDENGRLTNCYLTVVDAPANEAADMEAALRLLDVEPEG